jgi:hypothetical protein
VNSLEEQSASRINNAANSRMIHLSSVMTPQEDMGVVGSSKRGERKFCTKNSRLGLGGGSCEGRRASSPHESVGSDDACNADVRPHGAIDELGDAHPLAPPLSPGRAAAVVSSSLGDTKVFVGRPNNAAGCELCERWWFGRPRVLPRLSR